MRVSAHMGAFRWTEDGDGMAHFMYSVHSYLSQMPNAENEH